MCYCLPAESTPARQYFKSRTAVGAGGLHLLDVLLPAGQTLHCYATDLQVLVMY